MRPRNRPQNGGGCVMEKGAQISDCGQYRYSLDRCWVPASRMNISPAMIFSPSPAIFCMLNPSTADASEDDATIKRCIGFAKREGRELLHVINLFAGRATEPDDLFKMADPVGAKNEDSWHSAARMSRLYSSPIICGWGSKRGSEAQAERFISFMQGEGVELACLWKNKNGSPKHPLYIKADAPLLPFGRPSPDSEVA